SYSATISVSGGQPPYSWSLSATSLPLPPGLGLSQDPNDSSKAIVSGIPTTQGSYPFGVQITDGTGLTVAAPEFIVVNPSCFQAYIETATACAANATSKRVNATRLELL